MRLNERQGIKKSYANAHRIDQSYNEGDQVLLRVRPQESSIKFRKGAKFSPCYVGPFKIVMKVGPISYRLAFPSSLNCMHKVFDLYILQQYILVSSHVIDLSSLQMLVEGALMDEPIHILDQ